MHLIFELTKLKVTKPLNIPRQSKLECSKFIDKLNTFFTPTFNIKGESFLRKTEELKGFTTANSFS